MGHQIYQLLSYCGRPLRKFEQVSQLFVESHARGFVVVFGVHGGLYGDVVIYRLSVLGFFGLGVVALEPLSLRVGSMCGLGCLRNMLKALDWWLLSRIYFLYDVGATRTHLCLLLDLILRQFGLIWRLRGITFLRSWGWLGLAYCLIITPGGRLWVLCRFGHRSRLGLADFISKSSIR